MLPIRQISEDAVALTSYYGKVFVRRSSKKTNDYGQWLRNSIMAYGLDDENTIIKNLYPSNVFDNLFSAPRLFTILAMGFRAFDFIPVGLEKGTFHVNLDHTKRMELYGKEALTKFEKDGSIILGSNEAINSYLVVDKNNAIYYTSEEGILVDLGPIEHLLNLPLDKAPIDFVDLRVMGQNIPLGLILGYELGLDKLMRLLKVTPRRVPVGTRVNLDPTEYGIVFNDETLVFSREDQEASMVLAGFNEYHKVIKNYSVYDFDKRGVYLNVLESNKLGVRYLREIDLMYQMFVDPITRDLLIEMKEPTDFRGLLLRSCELLLTDQHPDELDPAFMRHKGYERMAGAVYSEMVKSIRAHNGRLGKARQPIDLNPYAVWKNISQDPSIALVSDINPIENLKQMEAVTFAGTGGRNSRSMTKKTRLYHPNSMGTISESTVDSSDVAINVYTSADPQYTSLRGMSKRYKIGETGITALLSTSALMSPSSDRDDPKRVNFASIQHSHGISCTGYAQSPVRTGYEQILAHRTSDMFAFAAKKPGRIKSMTSTGMIIEYEDGETKGIELGRRFGDAAGLTIPHQVVTDFKEGDAFTKDAVLCYNSGFFEKDILDPKNVIWKAGVMVDTVLMENPMTLEDSSTISPKIANLLTTTTTKIKTVVVAFDQSVHRLVKVGESVEPENILCIIEDAVSTNSELFDAESLDTLRVLSSQTPQAKVKGVVERIEVFYHGDKEDMTESLRTIANHYDHQMGKRNKSVNRKSFTGSVTDDYRVDGEPLALDTLAIKLYITGEVAAGVGDKGVFCNQMKTVFGEVMQGSVKTETGLEIDSVFSYSSIQARIVESPIVIGTTATLLSVIGKKAFAIYNS